MSHLLSRKQFIRGAIMACTAMFVSAHPALAESNPANDKGQTIQLTQEWDKTFPQSTKVDHQKVTFKNRYGITLAADLYLPKNRGNKKFAAIAVSGPFGAVKEQSSGLYAQTMAEHGFVTLAFDPSYTGESSGEPRNVASPEINTEDFMAAVDYLGLHPAVDRNRIGVIGICGFGGMALNAVAVDKRVKAVVTATMYDMSRLMGKGFEDSLSLENRTKILTRLSEQRWTDAERGTPAPGAHDFYVDANGNVEIAKRILPETLQANPNPVTEEFFEYYRTPRGFHKNSVASSGAFTGTSPMAFMNMPLLTYIKEISPRPILFIVGDKAHSRYFTEDAYKAAAEPKELVIIKDANHVDLYDRMDKIPFDKITDFFSKNLK
ncbi:alpha/beta hydrolase [Pectobacterium polaris]|uniref:alpha/beta hydrolase n=1 Tax=Pectobacterium polaris TaxID=2042057 RepID=UPI0015814B3B|nr:alpha/beta hydrolase [Pectobacterium polaris]MCL6361096.1 alpha/beta hydrolase [Pectobacterium polaris]MCU1795782.1 alpha/beta hydrolase [Pectobacterium polaris]